MAPVTDVPALPPDHWDRALTLLLQKHNMMPGPESHSFRYSILAGWASGRQEIGSKCCSLSRHPPASCFPPLRS
jgi:hypothetical protein